MLDDYKGYINSVSKIRTNDITSGRINDGSRVTMVVLLSTIKARTLKSGKILATCQAEDHFGSVNVTIFDTAFNFYRNLIFEESVVILSGKVSEQEDRETEIILEKLQQLPSDAASFKASPQYNKVYIKVPSINSDELNKVKAILPKFSGGCEVIIYCEDSGKQFKAPDSLKITPSNEFLEEISKIVGKNNIKPVEK